MAAEVVKRPDLKSAFFVQMDDSVLRLDIPMGQKVVCGAIVGLSREKGYCYASDDALAELLYSTPGSIRNSLSRLYVSKHVKNMGSKLNRKLVFVGEGKEKTNLTFQSQNESISTFQSQNESLKSQNEIIIYIIYKYKLKEGQPKGQPISSNEFYQLTFDHFWSLYPKHVKKQDAKKLFIKLKLKEVDQLLEIMPKMVRYHLKAGEVVNGNFIPNPTDPTTFLRGKRWEDECYLSEKISQDGARGSVPDLELSEDMHGCVDRFTAASNGDEVEMLEVDHAVMEMLEVDLYGAIDIINVDGLPAFKEKIVAVWGSLKVSA